MRYGVVYVENKTVISITPTISHRRRGRIKEIFDLLNFRVFRNLIRKIYEHLPVWEKKC